MVENPFIFGKVVSGEHFCDRVEELKQIKKLVGSRQHTVVISPRRYGKTSLVINALERSKTPFIYVDCSILEDDKGIVAAVLNEYVKKFDNIAIVEKFLKRFDFTFSLSLNPVNVTVSHVKIDSLKTLLMEVSKNYVLVFDEFQDLYEKDKTLVNKMRSIIQFLDRSVIMLGSKRHLLDNMFLKPRGIFYNFGYALHLEKIQRPEFKKFIISWFNKTNVKTEASDVEKILDTTECHPFFTQYFCHFFFEKRLSEKAPVEQTLQDILQMNSAFYEETYRSLPVGQRKALLLLSYGKKEVYSADLLEKFGITSSQALQKALNALVKKEIADKNGTYHILDLFFKHWLYGKTLKVANQAV